MIKKNIALLSPNKNAYSETFIQQHRNNLEGNIIFYFNGSLPKENGVEGKLLNPLLYKLYKLKKRLKLTTLSVNELALLKSLKKQKVQVVLAEYGTTGVAVLRVCKLLKLPLIPIFHGYDASILSILENNRESYKKLFQYSHKVIAVSNKIAETLISLGCNRQKIVVTPCAPDDQFFEIAPNFKNPLFIGVGRFVDKKAPYYTILAFSQVLQKYPKAKLIIGGDGALYEVCKNLIRYLKIEESVLLPGVLSKEQFYTYLVTSLAFVQHSITALSGDQEGTPVAVLEASAAGLPVIATYHAGIPDVIIDGETGLLVAEHDVEAMAEKMMLLLENKELAIQLGKNGKDSIKNNFTMEKHLKVLDELITAVIL